MIDEPARPRQPRRVSVVARALKPVQQKIGELQEATAFLVGRNLYAIRRPEDRVTAEEVAGKRQHLAAVLALFDATVAELPPKHRADTRLRDTRAAIDRLERSIDSLTPSGTALQQRSEPSEQRFDN